MDRIPRHTLFGDEPQEVKPQRLQPNIFARLARIAFRNSGMVLALWCIAIGLMVFVSWQRQSKTGQEAFEFLSPSKPAEYLQLLNRNFPHLESLATITLTNDNADELKQARATLLSKLESQTDKFDLVFAPGTGEYYDSHAILYLSQDEINARVAYALSLKPLFSAIAEAPGADSLATLVGEVSASIQQGRDPQGLDELFHQSAGSLQALMEGRKQSVDWTRVAGLNIEPQPTIVTILALPKTGQGEAASATINDLLGAMAKQGKTQTKFEQASVPPTQSETQTPPPSRTAQAIILACILGLIILASVLGRVKLMVMVVLPVAVTLAFLTMSLSLTVPVNVTSFWPILLGVGITATMLAARTAFAATDAFSDGRSPETALMLAAQQQGSGLVWLSIISIAVWAALFSLGAGPAVFIGGSAITSIIVAWFASITIIPAATPYFGVRLNWQAGDWMVPLYTAFFRNRLWRSLKSVTTFALFATAVAGVVFAKQAFLVPAVNAVSNQPVNIVVSSVPEVQATLKTLKSIPQAKSVRWLGAFLPQDVEAKQTILAGLKDQFPHIGSLDAQTPDDLRDEIGTLQESLSEIADQPTTRLELKATATEFRRSLELLSATSNNVEIVEVENRLFGSFNTLADRANNLAMIEKPKLETLDQKLKSLFLSADNVYRLEVTPVAGVSNAQLAETLFQNNLAVAHPTLVVRQQVQSTAKMFATVLASALILGLIAMCLGIAEITGILAALITTILTISILTAAASVFKIQIQLENIFITLSLLSVLFNLNSMAFLKSEVSQFGLPAALHSIEAWLPALILICGLIPIYLLRILPLQTTAVMVVGGVTAITAAVGFLLRPICLFFRQMWYIDY